MTATKALSGLDFDLISQYEQDHADKSPDEVALALIPRSTADQRAAWATAHLAEWIESNRRARAREAEAAAAEAEWEKQCAALYAEPWLVCAPMMNGPNRKRFRAWLGDRFDEWYARGLAAIKAGNGDRPLDEFMADWHGAGFIDYRLQQAVGEVNKLFAALGEQVRLQPTPDLLMAGFALGDGRRVTWGNATVEQHRQRLHMLAKQVAGTSVTAARHEAAIRMIEEAGATCLADLAGKADEPAA